MAGILDKKTRVLDYILTKEGRSQLKDGGDLRFVYATVSDRGLEYTSKASVDKLTYQEAENIYTTGSIKISDTERFYLGFEASSSFVDKLNPEYSLVGGVSYPIFTENVIDAHGLNNFSQEDSFVSLTAEMTGSFSKKVKSLKIIDTFNQIEAENIILDNQSLLENIEYDFESLKLEEYPTIESRYLNLNNEKTIQEDIRFFHKNNFKKLTPLNINGLPILNTEDNSDLDKKYKFIFKNYDRAINLSDDLSREDSIKSIIQTLENDNRLFKTSINITNPTENDIWISQIFEIVSEENKFNKLIAIDLGEFYFNDIGKTKQVFLYGKLYQSNSVKSDIRSSDEHAPVYEKEYILSREYTFVNIFTLVIE